MRSCGIIAGVAATLVLAACGQGTPQNAAEPHGKFQVAVNTATFPTAQKIAQKSDLVIEVRNSGSKTIPDLAVTLCNVTCAYPGANGNGTSVQAFAQSDNQPYLANSSRPIWIVDRGPGPCGYSCHNGGRGAYVTAYANTWAAGRLKPGKSVRFDWVVTAVTPGHHVVAWQVAAGLNGRAKAILSGGAKPHGTFTVDINSAPQQSYVNNNGQIVNQ